VRAWLALVGVVALVGAARAEEEDAAWLRARAHFTAGNAFYEVGEYARAVAEYETAYREKPLPELIFDVAQAQRKMGQIEKALASYERYVEVDPDGRVADEARVAIGLLRRDIEVRQGGGAVAPAPSTESQVLAPVTPSPPRQPRVVPATSLVRATPSAPPRKPLVKRAWFWAAIAGGVVVVATSVALGVVFGSGTRDPSATMGVWQVGP
jgi:tetratricopeptide (TPR) repeat protein